MSTTIQITNGLSPVSETTPESSPGPSPKRHCLQGPQYNAIEAPSLGGLAARACEKCRASKRKCDKKLPFCDRCKRLNAKCHYVQDITNNANNQGTQFLIYQPRSLSHDALFRAAEPLEGVTASQILSLISTTASPAGHPQVDWRSAINAYFYFIHSWFAAVHPTLFERQVANLVAANESPPQSDTPSSLSNGHADQSFPATNSNTSSEWHSKTVALLIVAMYLNTRVRITEEGEQPIFDETYRTVKRLLSSLLLGCVGDPVPSIELVQCGALVALYEYGHGEVVAAYQTLCQTVVTARVIDIKPGHLADSGNDTIMLSIEEEQSGCLWWAMFILEQSIHQDERAKGLPFLLESPSRNTLLPETPPMTPPATQDENGFPMSPPISQSPIRHLSTSVLRSSEKFGGFQLSAKTACLFHHAIRIDKERDSRPGKMPLVATYADLDREIRETTLTLLRDTQDWESTLDCFAMLVSALFTLYLPYLAILEHATDSVSSTLAKSEELKTALAALRFACQMSTDISCKLNADFEATPRSPALLCAPAGATCYFVIVFYSSACRIFPEEYDKCQANIAEKFESLRLFSFRWGIAEKMMSQLEKKIGVDRNHYLKGSTLKPPSYAMCFDFLRR
ncbi:uncharacterized protein F4822DRAFT_207374 [Hypoxylon trugodes]|uniref:uncharacterized protein n=1 Tax=Hypoxylon trugodes TaxID=326681 RepID=UPI0021A0F771|nr:uncharacterized protein F4822DRAFT_207374 [Hypoxylon trugodes]KAI1389654.1 hypothetical protein F4822DRAFT_207374 [Hypoxylon trugodes]